MGVDCAVKGALRSLDCACPPPLHAAATAEACVFLLRVETYAAPLVWPLGFWA